MESTHVSNAASVAASSHPFSVFTLSIVSMNFGAFFRSIVPVYVPIMACQFWPAILIAMVTLGVSVSCRAASSARFRDLLRVFDDGFSGSGFPGVDINSYFTPFFK